LKQQSFNEFKEDLKKEAGNDINPPVRIEEPPDFTWAEYFNEINKTFEGTTQLEYENKPYQQPEYKQEFKYVNLGPAKIKEQIKIEVNPEEKQKLFIALEFWKLKSPGRIEMGEPYRGEKRNVNRINKLSELVNKEKVEYIIPGNINGTQEQDDFFDFEELK